MDDSMQFLTRPEFWSMLVSIVTVLGFVVVSYAAVVAVGQLKEMTKARHLEAMLQVYEMIGSETSRKHRRFIYTELKSAPEDLTADEREQVEQVSVAFDRIGKLVGSDLVPKDELFAGHCEIIIRSWNKLEPYIMQHRKLAGGRHAIHFERLAALAQDYHSKHFPNEKLEIVNLWSNNTSGREGGT